MAHAAGSFLEILMPLRAREINDAPTEARMTQIIRHILNLEVKRLLTDNAALDVQVATNTSDITANASAIGSNDTDITALQLVNTQRRQYRSESTTVTVVATDHVIGVDATSGPLNANLPVAASSAGAEVTIMKTDAGGNAVTLDGNGAETINGAATLVLAAQYNYARVYCNGTEWFQIG